MQFLNNYEIFVMRNLYFLGKKAASRHNRTQVENTTQTQHFKKSAKGNMGSSRSMELCWYLPRANTRLHIF